MICKNVKHETKIFAFSIFAFVFCLLCFNPLVANAEEAEIEPGKPGVYEYVYAKPNEFGYIFLDIPRPVNTDWSYESVIGELSIDWSFDSEMYAANNPDVVAIFGNDPEVMLIHYLFFGRFEGKKGYAVTAYCGSTDDEYEWELDNVGTSFLRVLEFIDTHITNDMSDDQKMQAIYAYLQDERNIRDMDAGFCLGSEYDSDDISYAIDDILSTYTRVLGIDS